MASQDSFAKKPDTSTSSSALHVSRKSPVYYRLASDIVIVDLRCCIKAIAIYADFVLYVYIYHVLLLPGSHATVKCSTSLSAR